MYSRGVTRLSDTTQIYDNPTSHVFPPHNDIKHPGRKREEQQCTWMCIASQKSVLECQLAVCCLPHASCACLMGYLTIVLTMIPPETAAAIALSCEVVELAHTPALWQPGKVSAPRLPSRLPRLSFLKVSP